MREMGVWCVKHKHLQHQEVTHSSLMIVHCIFHPERNCGVFFFAPCNSVCGWRQQRSSCSLICETPVWWNAIGSHSAFLKRHKRDVAILGRSVVIGPHHNQSLNLSWLDNSVWKRLVAKHTHNAANWYLDTPVSVGLSEILCFHFFSLVFFCVDFFDCFFQLLHHKQLCVCQEEKG